MTSRHSPAQGQTLWQKIYEALAEEIGAGRYPPGTKLPTEAQLSQRFGVNRHTVRRALEALRMEGAIHVRRGSGAFVTQGRIDYPIGTRTRMSRNLAEIGRTPGRKVLRVESLPASPREAQNLQIEEGAPVMLLEGTAEADGVPILYAQSVFPVDRLPGIDAALAEFTSITHALARCGVRDYTRRWTRFLAERPGAMIARHLQMPETHPVLHTEGLNVDPGGHPVEYAHTWFCSDRVQLVMDGTTLSTGG